MITQRLSNNVKLLFLRHQFIFILFFLTIPAALLGQEHYYLVIKSDKKASIITSHHLKKVDSLTYRQTLINIKSRLHKQGFLLADFGAPVLKSDSIHVNFILGGHFKLAALKRGNVEEALLRKIPFKEKYYKNKPFRPQEVENLLKKIINYAENNGYPFSSVKLDSIGLINEVFEASLNYNSGVHITFDTVAFDEKAGVKPFFLSNYLQITPGKPFQQKLITNAYEKLKRLPYLKIKHPGAVTFQNNQATLHLDIERKKANQINGIIGILPNQTAGQKVLLTGQFDIQLHNLFSSGKGLALNWQRLNALSQFFHINYFHPNVLKSPLSLNIEFDLLKEDTTFLNRAFKTEFLFNKGNFGQYKLFAQSKTTSLLGTTEITNSESISSLDFNLITYGVGYDWSNLDDILSPKLGTKINVEGGVGNKQIKRNSTLAMEVYDTINLNSIQYSFRINAEKYLRVGKKTILSNRIRAGKIFNERLFRNDLYRIGGFKTLRGFNENFFFASDYVLANIELRYFFEENSYFLIFYDQAYVASHINKLKRRDYPLGLGVGINIATSAGNFSLIYALGKSKDQDLSFAQSKIHFGYISTF